MSYDLGRAIGAEKALSDWQQYAAMLERALKDERAAFEGVKAVRDRVVQELAKVAPNHPFLNKEKRNEIFQKNYQDALRKLEQPQQNKIAKL